MHDPNTPDADSDDNTSDAPEKRSAPELPDDSKHILNTDLEAIVEPPTEAEDESDDVEDDDDDTDEDNTESDDVATDEASDEETSPEEQPGKFKRFWLGYWHKKLWTIPLTLLVIILVVLAIPMTRYPILARFLQRSYAVTVMDSKTHTPVSGAKVIIGHTTATTDSNGVVHIRAKIGKRCLMISKQYYKRYNGQAFVGIESTHNDTTIDLVATGRQIPIRVVNTLTGAKIAQATVSVLNTEAKTNAQGMATIVLPTTESSYPATVAASGYNSTSTNISVTDKVVASNTFSITPTGKVYYLSDATGAINVDSANLDGTDPQIAVSGTGNESTSDTHLYHSTDWQYLVLNARRSGGQYNQLYLINTSNDQLTTIDTTPGYYQPIGWSGHTFVYEVTNATKSAWQAGQYVLKSYDADNGKSVTLASSTAVGQSYSYGNQSFSLGPEIINGTVLYAAVWWGSDPDMYNNQTSQVISIGVDGSDKTVLKSFALSGSSGGVGIDMTAYSPQVMYLQMQNNAGTTYYEYENNNLTQTNLVNSASFSESYPTYYASPSGNQTFWTTIQNGQNALVIGDVDGNDGQTISNLSNYVADGWYGNSYVLLSKGSNTLYIMPVGGGKATKITSYFQ